ncbi:MAG: hypothetical protein LM580_05325 [Thermofilum sp.]|nr:hypothetical protein [Thermofilum sp.]
MAAYAPEAAQRREPFFLFVHYWDPHTLYAPPRGSLRGFTLATLVVTFSALIGSPLRGSSSKR